MTNDNHFSFNGTDNNVSLYSLYSTVKYSLFFGFQTVVDRYNDYMAVERKLEKDALVTALRKLFILLKSAFGKIDKRYPLTARIFEALEKGNPNVFNENINYTQLIFELGGLLHDKNITDVTFKKEHDAAVFSAL